MSRVVMLIVIIALLSLSLFWFLRTSERQEFKKGGEEGSKTNTPLLLPLNQTDESGEEREGKYSAFMAFALSREELTKIQEELTGIKYSLGSSLAKAFENFVQANDYLLRAKETLEGNEEFNCSKKALYNEALSDLSLSARHITAAIENLDSLKLQTEEASTLAGEWQKIKTGVEGAVEKQRQKVNTCT